jgi:hypothetical protein
MVEGMEKLFLGALFAGNKLDVVDEQNVWRPIFIAELLHLLRANRLDQIVGKCL